MKKLKIALQSNLFYFLFFLFLSCFVFYFTKVVRYQSNIPDDTNEIVANLISFTLDGDKLSMLLKCDEKIRATYYIQSKEEKDFLINNLKIGQSLKLFGEKKEVLGKTIPNTFDYKKYLYYEQIYFCFQVNKLEILNSKIGFFDFLRNKMENRVKKLGNNAYLRAFVLGDKTMISSDEYEKIMKNGVNHLFALSGMHLSLLYFILNKIFSKIKYKKYFIYILLLIYLIITGVSVSFSRAILFMLFLDISNKMNFKISKIKILFLTASFFLIMNPFYIYNVGFWYTYVVTFSLFFCHSFLQTRNKMKQVILVSCITFLFSLPLSIYLNYEVNLFSIINNIFLVPFISMFVFPIALLSFLFPIFLSLFLFLLSILEKINSFMSLYTFFIVVGKISIFEVMFYYFFLVLSIQMRSKKIFFFLFLFFLFLYSKNIWQRDYEVYFIDVGQGDSTLFVSPKNQEVLLIDTGGNISYSKEEFQKRNQEFNLADNIVLFLKSKRIRKIDLLLITHGDFDHLGYALSIGQSIPIKKIMINKGNINAEEQKLIKKWPKVEKYKAKYFDFETYSLKDYNNENENSILTYIKMRNTNFLLMGDASKKVEMDFLKQFENKPICFLKVGHHGSNTSSSFEFLKHINPKYAIVSSGRNNRYHHPSKETLSNLEALHIKLLNTQEMGTIEIKIKKEEFHIIETLS